MPNATLALVLSRSICSLLPLCFSFSFPASGPLHFQLFELVCCCAHTTDGDRARIHLMTDIWNQALNSSMLYLLKAATGANPSPSHFPAALGSSKSSFTCPSSSRQSFIAIHFPIGHRMDYSLFLCSEFTLRLSSDSDSPEMRGKKRKKIKTIITPPGTTSSDDTAVEEQQSWHVWRESDSITCPSSPFSALPNMVTRDPSFGVWEQERAGKSYQDWSSHRGGSTLKGAEDLPQPR